MQGRSSNDSRHALQTESRSLLPWRWILKPRCWPVAVGFAILRALTALPIRWQLAFGQLLGRMAYPFASRRRQIAATNIDLCFPTLDSASRKKLVVGHFEALGMGIFEFALAWWASDRRLATVSEIVGLHHAHNALASGRGVLLLTGHFTTLEMGARLLTGPLTFSAMYRTHKNPLFDEMMRRIRIRRSRSPAFRRDDIRAVIRALRAGNAVWYAPDQNLGGRNNVVQASFFSVPARTLTATARLAKAGNALVVPYYPTRLPDGRYQLTLLPALQDFPSGDDIADANRINQVIEATVRVAPEQYLWVHRRFRPRRKGVVSPYAHVDGR